MYIIYAAFEIPHHTFSRLNYHKSKSFSSVWPWFENMTFFYKTNLLKKVNPQMAKTSQGWL